jgi:hypothetical protein
MRARSGRKDLTVIQPRLEVIKRCLDEHSRLETLRLHPLECFHTKVVNDAQWMKASRSDVDMSALGVFVTEPLDGCFDIGGALPFSQNHLAGVAPDADVEALAAHRAELNPHQPLNDYSRFLIPFLSLRFRHRRSKSEG